MLGVPKPFLGRAFKYSMFQKTGEGCGCFWNLLGGSREKLREASGRNPGKSLFLDRKML